MKRRLPKYTTISCTLCGAVVYAKIPEHGCVFAKARHLGWTFIKKIGKAGYVETSLKYCGGCWKLKELAPDLTDAELRELPF